jgi:uncharacterized membrane protein
MHKGRLEAFSDGVIAIIITIMVLELKVPHGADWHALQPLIPVFSAYVLSFVFVAIYWNNHHHLLQATPHVTGGILWANIHMLFWLSLTPFATSWMGDFHDAPLPTAVYGALLLCLAIAFTILARTIVAACGPGSIVAAVYNRRDLKSAISLGCYLLSIPLAFVDQRMSWALFVIVALIWIVPERRIESRMGHA